MLLKLGDHVQTRDGQDVGKIDKLILDPRTGEMKAAVIRKGFFLPDDIEVPIDAFQIPPDEAGGVVRLNRTADQVDELPRFVEGDYTTPPADYVPPFGSFGYPTSGLVWPIGLWPPAYPASTPGDRPPGMVEREASAALREQNLANAVIDVGSDVISRDGEKVGVVKSVSVDANTGRPESFIVRQGFLFTEDRTLPADTIASVDDGVVYLTLDKAQVE